MQAVLRGGFFFAWGRRRARVEWIVEVVLRCDTDTLMRYAFLRALGIDAPKPKPKRGAIVRVDAYADMAECFENRRRVRL